MKAEDAFNRTLYGLTNGDSRYTQKWLNMTIYHLGYAQKLLLGRNPGLPEILDSLISEYGREAIRSQLEKGGA